MAPEIKVPPSPSAGNQYGTGFRPEELNPELATAKMAEKLIDKLGAPAILNKAFVVRYGIFSGLNHTEGNKTGYNCSMRLSVYESVAHNSVNISGAYFEKLWAYLMKPKFIIQGMAPQSFDQPDEQKGGLMSWVKEKIFGGGEKQNVGTGGSTDRK